MTGDIAVVSGTSPTPTSSSSSSSILLGNNTADTGGGGVEGGAGGGMRSDGGPNNVSDTYTSIHAHLLYYIIQFLITSLFCYLVTA